MTLVGNHAVAAAVAQAMRANGSGVTSAFPITPATEILHEVRRLEAEGLVPSVGFNAGQEHEAMTAAIAASHGGTRSFIATSSPGFEHMYEMVVWAGHNRVPVVMALVNRADAPLNIWHGEEGRVRARDFTVQLVAENHQQAYDLTLQAFRIAERAMWMTIVNLAGFFISHSSDQVRILDDKVAEPFVGKFVPPLDPFAESISRGGLCSPVAFPLQRSQNYAAWGGIKGIVREVHDEFGAISGRAPGAYFNAYHVDASTKYVFLNYGFLSGTLRTLVDILRHNGVPVGLISGTLLRPFPDRELVEAIMKQAPGCRVVGVFDGTLDPVPGAVFSDLGLAFQMHGRDFGSRTPLMMNFRYGGGQNPSLSVLNATVERMMAAAKAGRVADPLQQLDRNSQGGAIALELSSAKLRGVLGGQAIIDFVGRGGQGAISAAANLATITNGKTDMHARGIPLFGSEKTGSPTLGSVVMDNQPISNFNNEGPRDLYVFFRPDLITEKHWQNLKQDGFFLVNTSLSPEAVRRKYNIPAAVKIYTVNASKMARGALGRDYPNNVLLAALSELRPDLLSREDLEGAIQRSLKKKGDAVIAKNISLIAEVAANLRQEGAAVS